MDTNRQCVFVLYDAQRTKELNEGDDLMLAIHYFYPDTWNSDAKCQLCGPLMAAADHVTRMLGYPPKLIELATMTFASIYKGKYTVIFGGPTESFSRHFISKICSHILSIVLLFYPSLASFLGSVESDHVLGSIVDSISYRPMTEADFNVIPSICYSKIPQRFLLKCIDIIDFASRQTEVLGSCLLLSGKTIKSNFDPEMTRMIQFCATCDTLRNKMGIMRQGCNVCPIFVSNQEYGIMAAKHRIRRGDFGNSTTQQSQDPVMRSPGCSLEREVLTKRKCSSRLSDDSGSGLSTPISSYTSSSDEENTVTRNGQAPEGMKELTLCFVTEGSCSLAIIMEGASQRSVNMSKYLLTHCAQNMKEINTMNENLLGR